MNFKLANNLYFHDLLMYLFIMLPTILGGQWMKHQRRNILILSKDLAKVNVLVQGIL